MAGEALTTTQVKPSQLADPIPGQEDLQNIIDTTPTGAVDLGGAPEQAVPEQEFALPGESAQELVAPSAPLDEEFSLPGEQPDIGVGGEFELEPERDFFQEVEEFGVIATIREEISDSLDRARVSFATTDVEREDALKNIYGEDNVRKSKSGKLFVRKRNKKDFEAFDPEGDEADQIDDVLDFARVGFEAAIENAFRAGGAISGFLATAPEGAAAAAPVGAPGGAPGILATGTAGAIATGIPGGIVGAGIAGAAGAGVAINAADFVQEELLDIPRDPKRSRSKETALAAGISGTFGALASAHAARKALKKINQDVATPKSALDHANNLDDAAEQLKKSGIDLDSKTGRFNLTPAQKFPGIPETGALEKELSTEKGFRDWIDAQTTNLLGTLDQITGAVKNAAGVSDDLGVAFAKRVDQIEQVAGKRIGVFRDEAARNAGVAPQPVTRFAEAVSAKLQQAGLNLDTKMLTRDEIQNMQAQFTNLTESQVIALGVKLKNFGRKLSSRGEFLDMRTIDLEYKDLTREINKNMKNQNNIPLAAELIKLKNAIRDDWTDAIGRNIGDSSRVEYQAALTDFTDINRSLDVFKGALAKDRVTSEALGKAIFTKGAAGRERVEATRKLLQERDPDMWRQIVDDFWTKAKNDHFDEATNVVDWKALENATIGKGGPGKAVLDEMFAGQKYGREELQALMSLGKATQNTVHPFKPRAVEVSRLRGWISKARNFITGSSGDALESMIGSMGKDKAVAKWLGGGGLELVVKGLPKKEALIVKGKLRLAVEGVLKTGTRIELQEAAGQRGGVDDQ